MKNDLKTRKGIIAEMIAVYSSNNDEEKNSFACESKIKQLSTLYKTIQDDEAFELEHRTDIPVSKVEVELISANDDKTINEIKSLEEELSKEIFGDIKN